MPSKKLTAEQYMRKWIKNATWKHLEREKHQARLKWCADQCVGDTFVDIGCALGHSTAIMKKFHPGNWTGIDFWAGATRRAVKLFPELKFKAFTFIAELWGSGIFDSVVCSEVIEHVEDDIKFVNMLWDIARRKLIVTTPAKFVNDPGHIRFYTKESLREAFKGIPAKITISADGYYFLVTAEREA